LAKGTVGDETGAAADSVAVTLEDGDADEAGTARTVEAASSRARVVWKGLERNIFGGLLGGSAAEGIAEKTLRFYTRLVHLGIMWVQCSMTIPGDAEL
jgi:hypothetical protein